MRATIISTLLGLGAVALAQDLTSLPVCAQTAALGAAGSTGCTATDVACLCQNFGALQGPIQAACTSIADQQAACAWGNSACATYGVSIPCDTTTPTDTDAARPTNTDTTGTTDADAAMSSGEDTTMATATGAGMSVLSGSATDSMMSSTTGMDMGMGTDTMTTSSMSSMTTSMMNSNATMATASSSNMTHSATMGHSATASGPTSLYTGAASAAAGRGGVFGAVMGVAALLAFF